MEDSTTIFLQEKSADSDSVLCLEMETATLAISRIPKSEKNDGMPQMYLDVLKTSFDDLLEVVIQ